MLLLLSPSQVTYHYLRCIFEHLHLTKGGAGAAAVSPSASSQPHEQSSNRCQHTMHSIPKLLIQRQCSLIITQCAQDLCLFHFTHKQTGVDTPGVTFVVLQGMGGVGMGMNAPPAAGGWNGGMQQQQQQMGGATAYAGAAGGGNDCQNAVQEFIQSVNDQNGVHIGQVSKCAGFVFVSA